jgi:hypothetical protein
MSIVRSKDGRYFDIPDKLLKKYSMNSKQLPIAPSRLRQGSSGAASVQIIIEEARGPQGAEVGGRMAYGDAASAFDEKSRMGDSSDASRSRCVCCGVRG